ncbi:hypothetical protein ACFORL_01245 [Legionella dresdenensis]|uniref:Uncharacterized protein n=1 Tax=Legionella dresdenensis TaxID=450200 RepID=A0ABV8CBM1_9GAMM
MRQEIITDLGYSKEFANKIIRVQKAEDIIDSLEQITIILNEDNTKKLSQKDIESILNGCSRCSTRAQRVAQYLESALSSSANFTREQIITLFSSIESDAALRIIINNYEELTGGNTVPKFSFENIIAMGKGLEPYNTLKLFQKNSVRLLQLYSPDALVNDLLNPQLSGIPMPDRIVDLLTQAPTPSRARQFGAQSEPQQTLPPGNNRYHPYAGITRRPQSAPTRQPINFYPAVPAYHPQTPILTRVANPAVSIAPQNYQRRVRAMMLWPHSQPQDVTQALPRFYLQAASPAEPHMPARQVNLPVSVPTPVPATTVSGNRVGFFNEKPAVQTVPPIQLPSISTLLKEVDSKIAPRYLNNPVQRSIFQGPELRPEMAPVKSPQQNIGL